jgi:hypothetical protein
MIGDEILERPELRDLKPETEREGLLYMKAYFTAIGRTLTTARTHGLAAVEETHRQILEQLKAKLPKEG